MIEEMLSDDMTTEERTVCVWLKLNEAIRHIQFLENKLLNPGEISEIS